jgi:hypothetical protein
MQVPDGSVRNAIPACTSTRGEGATYQRFVSYKQAMLIYYTKSFHITSFCSGSSKEVRFA